MPSKKKKALAGTHIVFGEISQFSASSSKGFHITEQKMTLVQLP